MKCPKCNAEVSGKFCRRCGTPAPMYPPQTDVGSSCPSCAASVRQGAEFCPKCAASLSGASAQPTVAPSERCPHCSTPLKTGARFCRTCGQSVAAAVAPSDVGQVAAQVPVTRPVQAPIAPPVVPPTPGTAREPLPESQPVREFREQQTRQVVPQRLAVSGSSHSFRNKGLIVGGICVLALATAAGAYWFVLRKKANNLASIIDGQAASQTASSPANTSTNETQSPVRAEQPATTESVPANGQVNTQPTSPSPAPPTGTRPRNVPVTTPHAAAPPPYEQAHQSAEQALSASRVLEPPDDNALFWARRAKSLGDPAADSIEQQVFDRQMALVQGAMQAHDYARAQSELSELMRYFPDRAELQQMPGGIRAEQQKYYQQMEQQRRQTEAEAQTKRFQFRHRHVSLFGPGGNAQYFCTGTLTVVPDGTVNYDCAQTDDPSGRCDHVSLPPGSLKQAKIGLDGRLHLASKSRGNFDFEGDRASVQQALTAVTPLVSR